MTETTQRILDATAQIVTACVSNGSYTLGPTDTAKVTQLCEAVYTKLRELVTADGD